MPIKHDRTCGLFLSSGSENSPGCPAIVEAISSKRGRVKHGIAAYKCYNESLNRKTQYTEHGISL